ncbi:hypothetical protein ANN_00132 [Periplaneta americana]|uniref:Reverse transcriptase domain-containing protein n=1 Tax=Periplaneta americana TaxID=6978 RepID=A0ABQ8TSB2_PERAM|nr:hypothetical protein ANN_00132 [Periplaneta americana]
MGFRKGRSCAGGYFTMKLLLEKHKEFNIETHMAFVDFKKAFDKVDRSRSLPSKETLREHSDSSFRGEGYIQYLDRRFPDRWIGRGGPIAWPPRSPDLNPLDFYLWGHLKLLVYSSPVPDLESLRNRIVACSEDIRNTPGVWDRVRRTVSSQFTARLSWLVLLAQSLAFTESRTSDLQRRSAALRTQVPQLRSTALELRASGSTVTDTTQVEGKPRKKSQPGNLPRPGIESGPPGFAARRASRYSTGVDWSIKLYMKLSGRPTRSVVSYCGNTTIVARSASILLSSDWTRPSEMGTRHDGAEGSETPLRPDKSSALTFTQFISSLSIVKVSRRRVAGANPGEGYDAVVEQEVLCPTLAVFTLQTGIAFVCPTELTT